MNSYFSLMLNLGSVTGFIGVFLMLLQVTLGLRQVANLFSRNVLFLNKIHKFLGIFGIFFVLSHPFFKAISYENNLSLVFLPNFNDPFWINIAFGRFALLLFLVLWFTSAILRSRIKFRIWKYLHFTSYIILALTFLHADKIGSYLSSNPFLFFIWRVVFILFFSIVVFRILSFAGFFKAKYKVIKKEIVDGVLYLELRAVSKHLNSYPGQYFYFQLNRFGEEHPFSIVKNDKESKVLSFGLKVVGRFTNKLSNISVGNSLFVEGPYGVFLKDALSFDKKVILAGGIGVTPFFELVEKFGSKNMLMFYANKSSDTAWQSDYFKCRLDERYFDVVGKLSKNEFLKKIGKDYLLFSDYYVCGPISFYNYYKEILLEAGVSDKKIHFEEFSL